MNLNILNKKENQRKYLEVFEDMLNVYYNETDESKKDKLREFIRGFLVKNSTNILKPMMMDDRLKLNEYFNNENLALNKKLANYHVDLNDFAIVSVDVNLEESLSPLSRQAIEQVKKFKDVPNSTKQLMLEENKKGSVWEFAILSEDRKSFVLLRDILENKVQPIENCLIWKNKTIGEQLEDALYSEYSKKYILKSIPAELMHCVRSKTKFWGMNVFFEEEKENGVFLKGIYKCNYDAIQHQITKNSLDKFFMKSEERIK